MTAGRRSGGVAPPERLAGHASQGRLFQPPFWCQFWAVRGFQGGQAPGQGDAQQRHTVRPQGKMLDCEWPGGEDAGAILSTNTSA
jgi:hypothetical protein